MTDARMRATERAARAEDSPEAQARVLVERLRVAAPCEACGGDGSLINLGPVIGPAAGWKSGPCPKCAGTGSTFRARLELGAYAGSEAARSVVAKPWCESVPVCESDCWPRCWASHDSPEPDGGAGEPFGEWIGRLSRWADVGPVPGWVMFAAVIPASRLAATHGAASVDWKVVEACEAWRDCPCEEHRAAWEAVCERDDRDVPDWVPSPGDGLLCRQREAGEFRGRIYHAMTLADAARVAGEPEVREAVSRSLMAWALGDS